MNSDLDRRALLGVVGIAGVAALAARRAEAGPLTPPEGPVTGTGKQLIEVEPRTAINPVNTPGDGNSIYRITQPGSYYLTANLVVPQGTIGIKVTASNVTIDMEGFAILIASNATSAVAGIAAVGTLSGITIRNGRFSGAFQFAAINMLDGGTGNNLLVEGVTIVGTGAPPSGSGIYASNNYVIRGCVISTLGGWGIYGERGALIESCIIRGCQTGLGPGQSGVISRCTIDGNSYGTNIGAGCAITDCVVTNNLIDGIFANEGCLIARNLCRGNGAGGDGAGIHLFGTDNRVEDNVCIGADRGIDVDAAGNVIVRNVCSGNGNNWDIVANNIYGPIIDRAAPGSPAVTGNAAASALGTTDPNANFTY
ncbi:MAG: hypothetical protein ACREJO_09975 [Phycisphaerales bacterium]